MDITSKKRALLILAMTSLLVSRPMFWFFNDPEGPNLLIVMVFAAIVYGLSLVAFFCLPAIAVPKKVLLTVGIQMLIVSGLYLALS